MSAVVNTHLEDAISVWCPTFPRHVTQYQKTVNSPQAVAAALCNLQDAPGFVSVYSFPNGHTKEDRVPQIDTLFIDMDIPSGGRYGRPDTPGEADREAWAADMEELLSVSRGLARYLMDQGVSKYWRAALSGHKGVHLYVDFPAVNETMGTTQKYKAGLGEFSRSLITTLGNETGLPVETWVDVDSSDLARLTRLPNTLHEGATRNFGEPRYCVPVSIGELAYVNAEVYERLTKSTRAVPEACLREESDAVGERLTQYIALARDAKPVPSRTAQWADNSDVLEKLDNTRSITLKYFLSHLNTVRPCMIEFRANPDAWKYGNQSHFMEFAIMAEAAKVGASFDVVCEFFSEMPDYNENWTKYQYAQVVRRGYVTPHHDTMWKKAPEFMTPEACPHCAKTMPRTPAF